MSELWNKFVRNEELTVSEIDALYEHGLLTMGEVDTLLEKAKCEESEVIA